VVTPVVVAAPAAAAPAQAAVGQMTYEQMFRTVAAYYDLDWRILAAQAYVESGFNPVALGSSGDLGLMQILPSTWQEWASQVDAVDPFDSYSNVLVAAVYLDYLRSTLTSRGYSEIQWSLVAYNWGLSQVNEFLDNGSTWDDLDEVRKNYARDILRIAESLPQS
jgi:membrane-bound lytic murein transglycosylase F